jgi:hypothetical protein
MTTSRYHQKHDGEERQVHKSPWQYTILHFGPMLACCSYGTECTPTVASRHRWKNACDELQVHEILEQDNIVDVGQILTCCTSSCGTKYTPTVTSGHRRISD